VTGLECLNLCARLCQPALDRLQDADWRYGRALAPSASSKQVAVSVLALEFQQIIDDDVRKWDPVRALASLGFVGRHVPNTIFQIQLTAFHSQGFFHALAAGDDQPNADFDLARHAG